MKAQELIAKYRQGERNFKGVNLKDENLAWENLSGSNFEGANLESVNFKGSILHEVTFQGANLSFSDLSSAELINTNLRDAKLQGANLSSTQLDSSINERTQFPKGFEAQIISNRETSSKSINHFVLEQKVAQLTKENNEIQQRLEHDRQHAQSIINQLQLKTYNLEESLNSAKEFKELEQQTVQKQSTQGKQLDDKQQWFEFQVVTVDAKGQQIKNETERIQFHTEDLGNGIVLEMTFLPSGIFHMGSSPSEIGRNEDESPQHQVTVPAFWIGKYVITQEQWKAVAAFQKVKEDLNPDPSRVKGVKLPVVDISWKEAIEFCARLRGRFGREFRLPSEAEWEYACRSGTTTPFHYGETITTDLANYCGTSYMRDGQTSYGDYGNGPKGVNRKRTILVGSLGSPNAFGLSDMHGNVWEWCLDHWHPNYNGAPVDGSAWLLKDENDHHILRGGSWLGGPRNCRSAYRNSSKLSGSSIGFRVVCDASTQFFVKNRPNIAHKGLASL